MNNSNMNAAKVKREFERLKKQAEDGDAKAQYTLSRVYRAPLHVLGSGDLGIQRDKKLGMVLLRKAAENEHSKAQYELACEYRDGNKEVKLEKNLGEFVKWLKKSAENGYAEAQFYLAALYKEKIYDVDIKQDKGEYLEWLLKAAENGHPVAQFNIAKEYLQLPVYRNDGKLYINEDALVKRDYEQSETWINKSLDRSNSGFYAYMYGMFWHSGCYGIKPDLKKAIKYYEIAAELEEPQAIFILGLMYAIGAGVNADRDIAIGFFEKAAGAKGGLGKISRFILHMIYYRGWFGLLKQDERKALQCLGKVRGDYNEIIQSLLSANIFSERSLAFMLNEGIPLGREDLEVLYHFYLLWERSKWEETEYPRLYQYFNLAQIYQGEAVCFMHSVYDKAVFDAGYEVYVGVSKVKDKNKEYFWLKNIMNLEKNNFNEREARIYEYGRKRFVELRKELGYEEILKELSEIIPDWQRGGEVLFNEKMNLCGGNVANAIYELSLEYQKADDRAHIDLLKKAYDEGEDKAAAAFNLARYYQCGYKRILERKPEEAASLYRMAMNKGIDEAQYYLGLMYAVGDGVKQDGKEAQNIFEELAESFKESIEAEEGYPDIAENFLYNMTVKNKAQLSGGDFQSFSYVVNKERFNNNDLRAFYLAKMELQKRQWDNRYKSNEDAEKDFEKLFEGYKSGKSR